MLRNKSGTSVADMIKGFIFDAGKLQSDNLRSEAMGIRQELQALLALTRDEINQSLDRLRQGATESQQQFQKTVQERLDKFSETLGANSDRIAGVLGDNRQETVTALRTGLEGLQEITIKVNDKQISTLSELKEKISDSQQQFQKAVQERLDKFSETLGANADRISNVLNENRQETVTTLQSRLESIQKATVDAAEKQITALNDTKNKISESVSTGLKEIQEKNEKKLEEMRLTVDEKLHQTLNTRLTESFDQVTKQLIAVQGGLTEMQGLAQDVGSLKRTLTNVKVRGMIGEAQLHTLLDQFLSAEQYQANVPVRPRSGERVEFAVKLPGIENGEHVWLPIDSKFPNEDYQRLQDAYESGDKPAWDQAGKAFEACLHRHAADISAKYIDVPHTTEFALMFLPFESLYGEAIRRPGLFQQIQSKYHVNIVGPTTLVAFLNSLQVGFKTLAISKQSGEVWKVLGAVKTEFRKFGDIVSKVQKNLDTASVNLSSVSTRARQMEKKLSSVSELSTVDALLLLPVEEALVMSEEESDE